MTHTHTHTHTHTQCAGYSIIKTSRLSCNTPATTLWGGPLMKHGHTALTCCQLLPHTASTHTHTLHLHTHTHCIYTHACTHTHTRMHTLHLHTRTHTHTLHLHTHTHCILSHTHCILSHTMMEKKCFSICSSVFYCFYMFAS